MLTAYLDAITGNSMRAFTAPYTLTCSPIRLSAPQSASAVLALQLLKPATLSPQLSECERAMTPSVAISNPQYFQQPSSQLSAILLAPQTWLLLITLRVYKFTY